MPNVTVMNRSRLPIFSSLMVFFTDVIQSLRSLGMPSRSTLIQNHANPDPPNR
jgi:hypothetical protein